MPTRLDARQPDFAARFEAFASAKRETAADVAAVVSAIIADVRARGDAALADYTKRFDGLDLTAAPIRVSGAEIAAAKAACTPEQLAALKLAAERIARFHEAQRPEDKRLTDSTGVTMGYRWTPIDAVGIYVPGGLASYPSTCLMNAVPAKAAGVSRLVMCAPTQGGKLNPLVLAAADLAGVDEIYKVGGAQAVAALAYGTQSIARVDKITGPGNAYVAEAKRQAFGDVGIDMIAGPSEILVVADAANRPEVIAADLLSQAEHDRSAQAILITDDAAFADQVEAAVSARLGTLGGAGAAADSWGKWGGVIVVEKLDDAPPLIDRLAPEHLALPIEAPEALMAEVRHAGSIFLGRATPEAVGDYVGGPNHTLPTDRRARFSSGLSVTDFMKRTTFLSCTPESLAAIGPAAATLADAEGLPAHALSVRLRLAQP